MIKNLAEGKILSQKLFEAYGPKRPDACLPVGRENGRLESRNHLEKLISDVQQLKLLFSGSLHLPAGRQGGRPSTYPN